MSVLVLIFSTYFFVSCIDVGGASDFSDMDLSSTDYYLPLSMSADQDPYFTSWDTSYYNSSQRMKRSIPGHQFSESRQLASNPFPPGSLLLVGLSTLIPFPPTGSFEFRLPVGFFISELINKLNNGRRRHSAHDQFEMFRSLESNILHSLAVDGEKCVLSAICETARADLSRYSFLGEIIHLIFKPRMSQMQQMDKYRRAYSAGRRKAACQRQYDGCPFSLSSILTQF